MRSYLRRVPKGVPGNRGFSLLELVVAMAIFLLVGASALILFSRQQTNANMQQGMVGLSIGLRNAAAQLQLDLANAGTGSYSGYSLPTWPVGVTVVNNVTTAGTSCYNSTTGAYGPNCFDQLNILEPNPNVSPILATDYTGGTGTNNCSSTYVASGGTTAAYGQAPGPVSLALLQATANNYSVGDQLLFLKSDGSKMTTVVLTQAPTVAYYNGQPVAVQFTFNSTNSDGSNSTGTNFNYGSTTVPNDPLDITACGGGVTSCSAATNFGTSFCGSDWIFKLAPVTYYVNSSNPSDPQLTRIKLGTPTVVMDQVIGFKVGATIWNSVHSDITWGTSYYFYDASKYNINTPINTTTGLAQTPAGPDSPFLFSFIRAVRVSLIGRTQPATDPSFTFTNAFDGGRYYVQGASVIVSPRNLSMND
jgi:prepilin-type N-terminal cleavage/methylation domain-containing protein